MLSRKYLHTSINMETHLGKVFVSWKKIEAPRRKGRLQDYSFHSKVREPWENETQDWTADNIITWADY